MNYNDEHDFSSYESDEERYGLNNYGFARISEEVKEKNGKKSKLSRKGPGKLYFLCLWIAFVLSALGITVSIFTSVSRSNMRKEIEAATIKYSLLVDKISSEGGLIPLKDSLLSSAISGTKEEKCLDSEGNVVCQIYKVTVENDSDYMVYFKSSLELFSKQNSKYNNLKWVEIGAGNKPMIFGQPKIMTTTNWLSSYGIGANTTTDFYLVVWLSDNGQVQNESDYGTFTGEVTFEALSGDKITSMFVSK